MTCLIFTKSIGQNNSNQISLSGKWQVRLDSLAIGLSENWVSKSFVGTTISLPATLDDARLGTPSSLKPALNNYVLSNLARKHQYIGIAYYQRDITIPTAWKNKRISLTLERVIWQSTVYLDGKEIGKAESLVGSHEFDLPNVSAGKHLLTIAIDNGNKYPNINVAGNRYPDPVNLDMAHSYTNHTQIKWNGIIGEITLKASSKNAPQNLQVYTDFERKMLKFSVTQAKPNPKNWTYEIKNTEGIVVERKIIKNVQIIDNQIVIEINKPEKIQNWNEFNPKLYDLTVSNADGQTQTRFGYSKVKNDKGVLTLNNTRIFLRGNLECVIFPLTGHPPMQKSEWATLIKQAKNYGLNHLRFHSWCPPKAAFEAADEAGFYCQVELPHWNLKVGEDPKTNAFLKKEADKIINDYGNHPSFLMLSLGNELEGDANFMNNMVADLKKKDPRHLYATTTFSFKKPMGVRPEPEDDFFVTQWTDKGWVRGQGIFNDKAPHFDKDYAENSKHINVPLVTHEIGQYSVYPDLREIPKYTGVLMPLNFIAVKNDLEKKRTFGSSQCFYASIGQLAALLYKEEIERALKTPNIDGFQLLQLQDFPGQGTALVGLLNAFWESKGAISAQEFRQFNSEIVPLIRFEKAVYEAGETFKSSVEIANFYQEKKAQNILWTIKDDAGNVLKTGSIDNQNLTIGNNPNLGIIELPINTETAKRLKITVSLKNTIYENKWHIWVYPKTNYAASNIVVTSKFSEAEEALKQGKKVLFNPKTDSIEGIKGRFTPVFWSPVHFPDQPGTMGLLLNEKHPAFASFPTQSHTEWQWWDLCIQSKSVIIDSLQVRPIVQTIDNFVTNHHLAAVFEAKVGEGQLIFSAMDISTNLDRRPAARQLRNSLLQYMVKPEILSPINQFLFKRLVG
ncbi:MAG: glycoside hydrolase family 2 [Saprospiraceae bacterium]|nr:glycoside hydrolase family 2 [Saprospiraceae bacterium]